MKLSVLSILGCSSQGTHPTLRAAFRNSNRVWTRYTPTSERMISGTEGMTVVTAGCKEGRVAKDSLSTVVPLCLYS